MLRLHTQSVQGYSLKDKFNNAINCPLILHAAVHTLI